MAKHVANFIIHYQVGYMCNCNIFFISDFLKVTLMDTINLIQQELSEVHTTKFIYVIRDNHLN